MCKFRAWIALFERGLESSVAKSLISEKTLPSSQNSATTICSLILKKKQKLIFAFGKFLFIRIFYPIWKCIFYLPKTLIFRLFLRKIFRHFFRRNKYPIVSVKVVDDVDVDVSTNLHVDVSTNLHVDVNLLVSEPVVPSGVEPRETHGSEIGRSIWSNFLIFFLF